MLTVGIDIERIRDVDERLIRYVCSEKELEYVFAGNNQNETTKRFFRIWTVKEAYFKCLGTGITNLKSICIFDDEIKQKSESFYYQDYAVSIYNKNK